MLEIKGVPYQNIESKPGGFKQNKPRPQSSHHPPKKEFKKPEILELMGSQVKDPRKSVKFEDQLDAYTKVIPEVENKVDTQQFRNEEQLQLGPIFDYKNSNKYDKIQKKQNDIDQKEYQDSFKNKQQYKDVKFETSYNKQMKLSKDQKNKGNTVDFRDQVNDLKSPQVQNDQQSQSLKLESKLDNYENQYYNYHFIKKNQQKHHIFGGSYGKGQDFERYIQPQNKISQQRINRNKEEIKMMQTEDQKVTKAKSQEKQLLETLFENIEGYQNGQAAKYEIVLFLQNHPDYLEIYQIDQNTIHQEILTYPTNQKYYMNFQEFFDFLNKQIQDKVVSDPNTCLLSDEILLKIQKLYESYGKQSIQEIIEQIRQNDEAAYLFELKAVYDPESDTYYNFDQILTIIQEQAIKNQYLFWDQFKQQFVSLKDKEQDFLIQQTKLKALQNIPSSEIIIQPLILDKLCSEFILLSLQKDEYVIQNQQYNNMVDIEILIPTLQNIQDYNDIKNTLARSKYGSLGSETIEQVINRMQEEAFQYIDIEEFLSFFTMKGRPEHYTIQEVSEDKEQDKDQSQQSEIKNDTDLDQIQKAKTDKLYATMSKDIDLNHIDYEKHIPDKPNLKFTVPQEFNFSENNLKQEIKEKRKQEMLDEIAQKDVISNFRAITPPQTTTTHLYHDMVQRAEMDRQERKRQSRALSEKLQKPFSFYYRDLNKSLEKRRKDMRKTEDKFMIYASPVPQSSKNNYYQMIQEQQEKQRQDHHDRWVIIQEHKQKKMQEQIEKEKQQNVNTFHRSFTRLPVPDFLHLQQKFQKSLELKKKSVPKTEIKPFNFEESKKKPMPQIKEHSHNFKHKDFDKDKYKKSEYKISNTKANQKLKEFRQKEQENKKNQELQKQKEEDKRKEKQNRMKNRVKNSDQIQDNSETLKIKTQEMTQEWKKTIQQFDDNYKKNLKEIMERVDQQPLLFERTTKVDLKLEKTKSLVNYYQTMKKNGIKEKDIKGMFKKDEWKQISDYLHLQKQTISDENNSMAKTQNQQNPNKEKSKLQMPKFQDIHKSIPVN